MGSVIPGKIHSLNLEKMITARDKKFICPACCAFMRYQKLSGKIASWAPSPYAWLCPTCPVTLHDGSIVSGEQTWISRFQLEEMRRLNGYLNKVIAWHRKRVLEEPSQD